MNKITTIRLRFWLPFSIFTTITGLLIFFSLLQYEDSRRHLEESTITSLKERLTTMGNRLERFSIYNLDYLVSYEIAELNFSNEAQSIALVDDKGIILNGSLLEWKDQPVTKCIPDFNTAVYRSTLLKNIQKTILSGDGNHIYAYEPVMLPSPQGEIRSVHLGLLFVDYNLSRLRSAQRASLFIRISVDWGIGMFLMIVLYLALRFWMTIPFWHMRSIINRFGKGSYDARIDIKGNGELAELGNAFNRMAEDVSSQRNKMHELLDEKTQIEKDLLSAKHKAEESDNLKSAFLANMSHEIRTPMNGILGFTSILEDPSLSENDREKYIAIVHKSSQQLLDIINGLIDISKIEAGQETLNFKTFNLNQLANDLISFFLPQAETLGLKLVLHKAMTDRESLICSDPVKLRQILVNLLGNAFKFTSEGSITLSYRVDGPKLVFTVEDTGIGIAPELFQVIFDRFRQAEIKPSGKFGGTGLGLSISKSYAEMLGGSAWVESEPGKGSRFFVSVPYVPGFAAREEGSDQKDDGRIEAVQSFHGKTILLVDDLDDNALFINHILRNTRVMVMRAKNGKESIEFIAQHPGISLVLMDIKMPDMDGYEATRKIKSIRPLLPVIATTAYALAGDREKCLAAGCDDYLCKPISKEKLLVIIEKFIQ
ncbi:MAG: ATP-binding protein [Bacteroidota bacterium]